MSVIVLCLARGACMADHLLSALWHYTSVLRGVSCAPHFLCEHCVHVTAIVVCPTQSLLFYFAGLFLLNQYGYCFFSSFSQPDCPLDLLRHVLQCRFKQFRVKFFKSPGFVGKFEE